MTQTFEAVYENGVLRPLRPLEGVAEHTHVTVSIEQEKNTKNLLKCCGTVSDEDTREIQEIIEREFEQVNPDDWK